ncbi:MAG: antibiotic biosynthesis monooxygenase [Candidatus Binatia bacterium]|nr:MAG: antibiotic biosynthesis monooxygenase [Candidatus Binatia bacterium]
MPITVVAEVHVQKGSEAAFQKAAEELVRYVTDHEPDTLMYVLHQSTTVPTKFLFYEVYADEAALARHGASEGMQKFFSKVRGLLDGAPEIETFQEVAGKR